MERAAHEKLLGFAKQLDKTWRDVNRRASACACRAGTNSTWLTSHVKLPEETLKKLEDVVAEAQRAGISSEAELMVMLGAFLERNRSKASNNRPLEVQYVEHLLVIRACTPAASSVGMLALGQRTSKSASKAVKVAQKQADILERLLGVQPLDPWTEDDPRFVQAHVQFLTLEVKDARDRVQAAVKGAISLQQQEATGAGGGDAAVVSTKTAINDKLCVLPFARALAPGPGAVAQQVIRRAGVKRGSLSPEQWSKSKPSKPHWRACKA